MVFWMFCYFLVVRKVCRNDRVGVVEEILVIELGERVGVGKGCCFVF